MKPMCEFCDVKAFMTAMEQRTPDTFLANDFDSAYPFELRARLIAEEAQEFVKACGVEDVEGELKKTGPHNLVEMIDALVDIFYVTYGAFVSAGIDARGFQLLWNEIHATNMAKTTGPVRADGKRLKPEGWTPPRIDVLLAMIEISDIDTRIASPAYLKSIIERGKFAEVGTCRCGCKVYENHHGIFHVDPDCIHWHDKLSTTQYLRDHVTRE